jgi:adenosine deaminase
MEDHVVDQLYRSGISLSINTDGRTISSTTLSQEYRLLAEHFGWTKEHFRSCNLEAIRHAFTDEATKRRLESKILAAYG